MPQCSARTTVRGGGRSYLEAVVCGAPAAAIAARTLAVVIGSSRTRAPDAAKTAFAIAAATGTVPTSPTPVDLRAGSPAATTSISAGTSRNVAIGYVSQLVVTTRPFL